MWEGERGREREKKGERVGTGGRQGGGEKERYRKRTSERARGREGEGGRETYRVGRRKQKGKERAERAGSGRRRADSRQPLEKAPYRARARGADRRSGVSPKPPRAPLRRIIFGTRNVQCSAQHFVFQKFVFQFFLEHEMFNEITRKFRMHARPRAPIRSHARANTRARARKHCTGRAMGISLWLFWIDATAPPPHPHPPSRRIRAKTLNSTASFKTLKINGKFSFHCPATAPPAG